MKFIKSLTLKLLILAFTFVSLSSQNHTIFLYGSTHGIYEKTDMQILYKNIAEPIIEQGGTVEFWPKIKRGWLKRKKFKEFCNLKEMNSIYRTLVANVHYRQLKKEIVEYYEGTGKPINIIAIGNGIKILKNFLQECYEEEYNCINKAIIIENKEIIERDLHNRTQRRSTESLDTDIPFAREIVSAENVFAEYSELEPNTIDSSVTDLSDKVVVVDAEEYFELLEQHEADKGCCSWVTKERVDALIKLGALAATIVAALI